jgi:hypothetical protein
VGQLAKLVLNKVVSPASTPRHPAALAALVPAGGSKKKKKKNELELHSYSMHTYSTLQKVTALRSLRPDNLILGLEESWKGVCLGPHNQRPPGVLLIFAPKRIRKYINHAVVLVKRAVSLWLSFGSTQGQLEPGADLRMQAQMCAVRVYTRMQ